jgi:hypothetical protein
VVWAIYNWIDDLAGPYGAAMIVSGAIIGAIYWVLSASRSQVLSDDRVDRDVFPGAERPCAAWDAPTRGQSDCQMG